MWYAATCAAIVALAWLVLMGGTQSWSPLERRIAIAGLIAHVVSAFALLAITAYIYGYGDLLSYFREGEMLARYIRVRGGDGFGELFSLIMHGQPPLPFVILGAGTSTGTMSAIGGFFMTTIGSMWVSNLFISTLAFSGQVAIVAVLRTRFDESLRTRVVAGGLLLPSAVFWSSGLVKEGIAIFGMGWMLWGLDRVYERRFAIGLPMAVVGGVTVSLVKAYILFPLIIAVGVYVYWDSAVKSKGDEFKVRPLYLLLSGAASVFGLVLIGQVFPEYSIENLGEQAAMQQYHGSMVKGGSNIQMGDAQSRSLLGQLAFAPMGLIAALFRPFIFEVRSPIVLLNALETTALTFMVVTMFYRAKFWGVVRIITRSPILMFCVVFSVLAGVGIGVTTTNLGTLSRYRIPMMPFYCIAVLAISALAARRETRESLVIGPKLDNIEALPLPRFAVKDAAFDWGWREASIQTRGLIRRWAAKLSARGTDYDTVWLETFLRDASVDIGRVAALVEREDRTLMLVSFEDGQLTGLDTSANPRDPYVSYMRRSMGKLLPVRVRVEDYLNAGLPDVTLTHYLPRWMIAPLRDAAELEGSLTTFIERMWREAEESVHALVDPIRVKNLVLEAAPTEDEGLYDPVDLSLPTDLLRELEKESQRLGTSRSVLLGVAWVFTQNMTPASAEE